MDKIETITTEFFKRRFPNKDIELEKRCGYFQEWEFRFRNGRPDRFMDTESLTVWIEMNRYNYGE